MGSLTSIKVPKSTYKEEAVNRAFDAASRVDSAFSLYKSGSPLSKLNSGMEYKFDLDSYRFIKRAFELEKETNSAFSPSIQPLLKLGFTSLKKGSLPSDAKLKLLKKISNSNAFVFADSKTTVKKTATQAALTFDAVAKGYAVDRAALTLKKLGVNQAVIDSGKSSYHFLGNRPKRKCWAVSINHPGDKETNAFWVSLKSGGLSTSGLSGKRWQVNGKEYSHIFNPLSGKPIEISKNESAGATIWGADATSADAWSTAILVAHYSKIGIDFPKHMSAVFYRFIDEKLVELKAYGGAKQLKTESGKSVFFNSALAEKDSRSCVLKRQD